jgi:glycosyltransferase involved in cell wall biosynthesis
MGHGAIRVLMSETQREDEPRRWWKELTKSMLYVRHFQSSLVGGRSHRDYLVSLGFPVERIFLGYDVVDNEHFSRLARRARSAVAVARARQPGLPARPFFLSMTRLLARKAIPDLVHAYAEYRDRVGSRTAWDLVICGTGPAEAPIRAAVRAHGIEPFVHLPGFIAYDRLGDWYGLAEAFVHVPKFEPWGLVINEACAAGLPIVCGRSVGARHELVRDGQSGFVIEPGNTRLLADALVRLHEMTPQQRAAFGEFGNRLVSGFGPEQFAEGLMSGLTATSVTRRPAG